MVNVTKNKIIHLANSKDTDSRSNGQFIALCFATSSYYNQRADEEKTGKLLKAKKLSIRTITMVVTWHYTVGVDLQRCGNRTDCLYIAYCKENYSGD